MKLVLLFFTVALIFIKATYALPIGVLIIGYDFIFLMIGIISTTFISLYFYFKSLKLKYKILIFVLIIFVLIISGFLYKNYKKNKAMEEYSNNIELLKIKYNYEDFKLINSIGDKLKILPKTIKENVDSYYMIDVRELSEYYEGKKENGYNFYNFKNIKPTYLLKNHKTLLGNINKPIVLTCVIGGRSKLVANTLKELGYDIYYVEGGFNKLGLYELRQDNYRYNYCNIGDGKTLVNKIIVGRDDHKSKLKGIHIPYMELLNDDIINLINKLYKSDILNKNNKLVVECENNGSFNCSIGRESMYLLLEELGFNNLCISRDYHFR